MTTTVSARPADAINGGEVIEARIDLERLDRNIAAFHARAHSRSVKVRAHVKGHRCIDLARRQVAAGATGIAVHFASEARRYIAAGLDDVLIAQPWREPWRWRLLAELAADCRLTVHVNSPDMVRGLAEAAQSAGTEIHVLLRLDDGSDPRHTSYEDLRDRVDLVRSERGVRFDGVYAYQGMPTGDAVARHVDLGIGAAEHVVRMAERLRADRRPCPIVTVAGTPAAAGAATVEGITEICAGAYALLDAGMAAAGVCAADDIAISVRVRSDTGIAAQQQALQVLRADPYPWQDPALFAPTPGVWTAPLHICPLAIQLHSVAVFGPGRQRGIWEAAMPRDEIPASAAASASGPGAR